MGDMFRIRYEGRDANENIIGVLTHFTDSYDKALASARKWLDLVYGKDSVFDLSDAGPTFQYGT